MKLEFAHSLRKIASLIDREFIGHPDFLISGLNEIHKVEAGDLMFVDHPKYYDKALKSNATTILINKKVDCPEGKALIISDDPFGDYNKLTQHFSPFAVWSQKDTKIHDTATIFPNVTIGDRVNIGRNTIIYPGVIIYNDTTIGDNVIIHANTTIGADAFYFQKRDNGYNKMHSCGSVTIEDDVEIGPSCTIDKGVSGQTIIGKGSKLDAQVHVGHDTTIGRNCLFAAQVGIAGCVTIEDDVILWGQAGIPADITLKTGTVILGQSAPMKDTEEGKTYLGSPAKEARTAFKELALMRKLPEMLEVIRKVE